MGSIKKHRRDSASEQYELVYRVPYDHEVIGYGDIPFYAYFGKNSALDTGCKDYYPPSDFLISDETGEFLHAEKV